MAKRRSQSAASLPERSAQARRAKKKPALQHKKKPSGSATESLREEAERLGQTGSPDRAPPSSVISPAQPSAPAARSFDEPAEEKGNLRQVGDRTESAMAQESHALRRVARDVLSLKTMIAAWVHLKVDARGEKSKGRPLWRAALYFFGPSDCDRRHVISFLLHSIHIRSTARLGCNWR